MVLHPKNSFFFCSILVVEKRDWTPKSVINTVKSAITLFHGAYLYFPQPNHKSITNKNSHTFLTILLLSVLFMA